jgi:hypothetical protein
MAQRVSSKMRKTITTRVSARSGDRINNGCAQTAQARLQGISARQKSASKVPT